MRRQTFGILLPSFWAGETGRHLQQLGKDAVILAAYVTANDHANMLGLYELPPDTVLEDLPVIGEPHAIVTAFDALAQAHYADYDEATGFIWVREMARFRLNLERHERLSADDKRRKGAVKLYEALPENAFLGPFYDRYQRQLRLPKRRGTTTPSTPGSGGGQKPHKGLQSESTKPLPNEGAKGLQNEGAKGLRGGVVETAAPGTCTRTVVRTDQNQEPEDQDQDQDQDRTYASTSEVLPTAGVRSHAARARETRPTLIPPYRNFGHYAFPNDVIGVPQFAHRKFIDRLVNAGLALEIAERQLFDWYARTADAWRGRDFGDNELNFWDKRFEEWRGTTPSRTSSIGSVAEHNRDFIARRRGLR